MSDQLDHLVLAVPLEWNKRLSQHRPLLFLRRKRRRRPGDARQISDNTVHVPGWGHRVATSFGVKVQMCPAAAGDPLQRLRLMKEAIRQVSDAVDKESWVSRRSAARQAGDELSVVMGRSDR